MVTTMMMVMVVVMVVVMLTMVVAATAVMAIAMEWRQRYNGGKQLSLPSSSSAAICLLDASPPFFAKSLELPKKNHGRLFRVRLSNSMRRTGRSYLGKLVILFLLRPYQPHCSGGCAAPSRMSRIRCFMPRLCRCCSSSGH